MRLLWYILRRVAFAAVALVVVSFTVFSLLFISPGSPEQVLLQGSNPTPQAIAAVRMKFHLDEPFMEQYGRWLLSAAHGNLGTSIDGNEPVTAILRERFPITVELAIMAVILVIVIGVPAGMLAGIKSGTIFDRFSTVTSTVAVSAPSFAIGIVLLYVFGVMVRWFPVYGAGDGVFGRAYHLLLPALALAAGAVALVQRQTRAAALKVGQQDYLTFARSRGLATRLLWTRYATRNSSLPIVTSTAIVLSYLLTGAVLVEQTFSLPGIGSLVVTAADNKDIPVLQGTALLASAVVVAVNLLLDVSYVFIDPRVRRELLS